MYIDYKYRTLAFLTAICVGFCTLSAPLSYADESFKEEKTKEGFIVDLKKLLKKTKDKIEDVDDKLEDQALERRNQKRAAKAHEYYTKGMEYFEEGEFEKAEDYWEKAVRITEHPEMDGYIKKEIKKSKKQAKELAKQEKERLKRLEQERGYSAKEVEEVYELGVKFFNKEKWLDARDQFEKVDEMFPNHKATRSYLMLVDRKIQIEQQEIIEETLRENAERAKEEKIAWRKELEEKEFERQRQVEEQANDLYTEALFLYKAKRFEDAKQKFQEVEWVLPDYKKTLKYLAEIDEDIRRYGEVPEEVMLEKIDQKIEEVQEERLRRVEKEIALKKAMIEDKERKKQEEAAFLYDAAMGLYDIQSYEQALAKFNEVETIIPDYKATRKYVAKLTKLTNKDDAQEKDGIFGWFTKIVEEKELTPEEKIAEEKRLAKKRKEEAQAIKEEKANFAYKAALAYYENGLMQDATERFYEVQRIYPGYKSTVKYLEKLDPNFDPTRVESYDIQALPLGRPFEELYDEAVKLYQEKKLDEARFKFNEIAKYEPDYRATQTYLNTINQNLAHKAGAKISNLDEMNLIAQAEINRDEQMFNEAEENYKIAVDLYDRNNLTQAKAKFIAVEAAYPDFRDTRVFLEKIDEIFNNGGRYSGEVAARPDDYQPVKSESDEDDGSWGIFDFFKRDEPKSKPNVEKYEYSELQDAYERAVALYKVEEYGNAREIFERILLTDPKYRWAGWYLRRIGRKMEIKSELYARGLDVPEDQTPDHLLEINDDNRSEFEKHTEKLVKRQSETLEDMEIRYQKAYKELQKSKDELRKREMEWEREILGPSDDIVKAIYGDEETLFQAYLDSAPKTIDQLKEELNIEIFKELGMSPEGKSREDAERSRLLAKIDSKIEEMQKQEEENIRRSHQIDMRTKAYRQQADGMTEAMLEELKKQQQMLSKEERNDWWRRQQEIRAHLADKKEFELIRQVEPIYNEARVFYEEQNYVAAREQFKLVNKLYPGYKQTELYIQKSQKKIDGGALNNVGWNERKENEYLKQELVRMKENKIKEQTEVIMDKETELRLQREGKLEEYIENEKKQAEELARMKREEEKRRERETRKLKKDIDKLYKDALEYYRNEKIIQANENFEQIDAMLLTGGFSAEELKKYRVRKQRDVKAMEDRIRRNKEKQIMAQRRREEKHKQELEEMKQEALDEQEDIAEAKKRLEKEKQELAQMKDSLREDDDIKVSKAPANESWSERRARKREEKDEARIRAFEEREMERRRKEAGMQESGDNNRVTVGMISDDNQGVARVNPRVDVQQPRLNVVQPQTPMSLEAQILAKRQEITQLLDERNKDLVEDREKIYQEFQANLNALYRRAEMFYEQENYTEAMRLFTEIDEMEQGYHDTARYISNLRAMNVSYTPAHSDYAVIKSTSYDTLNNRNIIISETLDQIEQLRP